VLSNIFPVIKYIFLENDISSELVFFCGGGGGCRKGVLTVYVM